MKLGYHGWEAALPSPLRRVRSQHLVKLFVSALLVAVAFRLLYSRYDAFRTVPAPAAAALRAETSSAAAAGSLRDPSSEDKSGNQDTMVTETTLDISDDYSQKGPPSQENTGSQDTVVTKATLDNNDTYTQKGKCNIFTGEWIRNPSGPAYTNTTCPYIEVGQNCMKNGRPDTNYLYWRWKPHDCDVALFDAEKFLDAMRNKSLALIGDSIFRNHAQSLLCLLYKVEEPVEVYHDETYKCRRWHFPSRNFTLSLIWAPFLVKADIFEDDDGKSTSEIQLHLDTLETKWTSQYHNFDYIVISGGQWFLKTAIYWENNTIVGCHYCNAKNLTELGLEYPYRKVLGKLFDFVTTSDHKPRVFYRTWTPAHFENGEWSSGGTCDRTAPYQKGEYNGGDIDRLMRSIELEEFNKAMTNGSENGVPLNLLDTYHLSLLRPDGHSARYRTSNPFNKVKNATIQYDCLHWCLPGPIDYWNDLIMAMVLNE